MPKKDERRLSGVQTADRVVLLPRQGLSGEGLSCTFLCEHQAEAPRAATDAATATSLDAQTEAPSCQTWVDLRVIVCEPTEERFTGRIGSPKGSPGPEFDTCAFTLGEAHTHIYIMLNLIVFVPELPGQRVPGVSIVSLCVLVVLTQ